MSIVSITVCEPVPGGIVADGANDSVAPVAAGGIVAASTIGFGLGSSERTTVRLKVAGCPGFTLAEEGEAVRMKSPLVTSKVNGDEVPPPGGGFLTETLRVPACAKSSAGMTA